MSEEHPNIRVKIDVTQIDKSRLFTGKNGAKYLDLFLFYHPKAFDDGRHVDYSVSQDVSKQDREAGVKSPFIGSGTRIVRRVEQTAPQATTQRPTAKTTPAPIEDDVPF